MSGKFLLLLKSKNVVHIICSAHLTCTCERRMNFKRVSVVEHNGNDKNGDICLEKKNDHPGIFPFFASPAAGKQRWKLYISQLLSSALRLG